MEELRAKLRKASHVRSRIAHNEARLQVVEEHIQTRIALQSLTIDSARKSESNAEMLNSKSEELANAQGRIVTLETELSQLLEQLSQASRAVDSCKKQHEAEKQMASEAYGSLQESHQTEMQALHRDYHSSQQQHLAEQHSARLLLEGERQRSTELGQLYDQAKASIDQHNGLHGEVSSLQEERNVFKTGLITVLNETAATFHTLFLEDKWEEQFCSKDNLHANVAERVDQLIRAVHSFARDVSTALTVLQELESARRQDSVVIARWRSKADELKQRVVKLRLLIDNLQHENLDWQRKYHEEGT